MDDDSNVLLKSAQQQQAREDRAYSRLALASFICANLTLAGLLLGALVYPLVYLFLAFIPAIVTGHLARRQFKRAHGAYRNESMARYGLAIGYLGLFLSLFVIFAMIFGAVTVAPTT